MRERRGMVKSRKCIKEPWTKTTQARIESGRWGVGRAWESNGGKTGTTVFEQQPKKVMF